MANPLVNTWKLVRRARLAIRRVQWERETTLRRSTDSARARVCWNLGRCGAADGTRRWTSRLSCGPGDRATWVPPSWDVVVREHADRVYRLAYRLSGNRADAEDLTQETFVRVFRSLAEYTPGTFEGWLHRITTNLFLDMARRRQRIRFEALPDDAGDRLASTEAGPELAYTPEPPRPRDPGRARRAAAGLPRRGRPVRPRAAVLRRDRGHAQREGRHRALAHPPRPGAAARGAGPPRARACVRSSRQEPVAAQ